MKHKRLTRILALDLHPRSFGYVVFETPDGLLDWGVRSYRQKRAATDVLVRKRLRWLFDLWRPSVLVLCNPPRVARRPNPKKDRLLEMVVTEAKNHQILVRMLKTSPGEEQGKKLTKYENARQVAEHFPVLGRHLPPKRRAWESEHYRMSIFTAAALAICRTTARPHLFR